MRSSTLKNLSDHLIRRFSGRWEINLFLYLLTVGLWLLTVIARLKFNGQVFGFNYDLYQPDGAYYMMRTLNWISNDPVANADRIYSWYLSHGSNSNPLDISGLTDGTNPTWAVVNPRPIYPLISIPFVLLIGLSGMLVVPLISLLLLMLGTLYLSIKFGKRGLGAVIVLMIISSPTILRWVTANLTDSLLIVLLGLTLLLLRNLQNKVENSAALLLLVPLMSSTRFCLPILIGIAFFIYINRSKVLAMSYLIAAVGCALPAMLADVDRPVLPESSSQDLVSLMAQIPISFLKVAFFELAQLFVLDKILLFAFLFSCLLSLRTMARPHSQLFLVVLAGTSILSAVNGVIGVNFRYQLPLLPFMVYLLLSEVSGFKFPESALRRV
jgi:hypothetical protein